MQEAPHFDDWTQYGVVQVFDEQIVPNSGYDLHTLSVICREALPEQFSAPLSVLTSAYGDAVGDSGPCQITDQGYQDCWTSPEGFVGFTDISAVVDKFVGLPGAPQKARADVLPCVVDFRVDFVDIPAVVDGFLLLPYPCPPAPKCSE